eukprot:UN08288
MESYLRKSIENERREIDQPNKTKNADSKTKSKNMKLRNLT